MSEQKRRLYSDELHSFKGNICTGVLLAGTHSRQTMAGQTCLIVGVMLMAAAAPALAVSIALDYIFLHDLMYLHIVFMYYSNKAMQSDAQDCIEFVLFTI